MSLPCGHRTGGSPFEQVETPFQRGDAPSERVGVPVQRVGASFEQVGASFERVGAPFEQVEAPFQQGGARFERVGAPPCWGDGSPARTGGPASHSLHSPEDLCRLELRLCEVLGGPLGARPGLVGGPACGFGAAARFLGGSLGFRGGSLRPFGLDAQGLRLGGGLRDSLLGTGAPFPGFGFFALAGGFLGRGWRRDQAEAALLGTFRADPDLETGEGFEAGGIEVAVEPAALGRFGAGGAGGQGVQIRGDAVDDGAARYSPCLGEQGDGAAAQVVAQLPLVPQGAAPRVGGAAVGRLAESATGAGSGGEEGVHLLPLVPEQEVDGPGGERRLGEPLHALGGVAVPLFAQPRGQRVAARDELGQGEDVESGDLGGQLRRALLGSHVRYRTAMVRDSARDPSAAPSALRALDFLFAPDPAAGGGVLWPRWLFLRALGLIFFSAFYSLAFQIQGLIGPRGVLPAGRFLSEVASMVPGAARFYYVPTALWLGSGSGALTVLVWGGLAASILLTLNIWPRATIAACAIFFLSFITAAQEFSSYQSDGMLLEAAFLSLFFAPRGLHPGLGADCPPSRASLFLLRWEWFRIYFESGVVKLLSGDEQWRNMTAMDHYYENGPLPTWIGWYAHQLPHGFHAATAVVTLAVELGLVWLAWLPRPFRLTCFAVVTALQAGIILSANYAFLNYLVLVLGFLLLDDRICARLGLRQPEASPVRPLPRWRLVSAAVVLAWIFWATLTPFLLSQGPRFLRAPASALGPFRIANQYGLFAVMTRARYEIEFQGTLDGRTWIPYPFRYKPQDPAQAPGIYAPYQPRFEWNLWFASLAPWQQNPWVVNAEVRLAERSPAVLALFRRDPFGGTPPQAVRTVLWQYWFTDRAARRATGMWWRRELLGEWAPRVGRRPDGTIGMESEEPLER